MSCTCRSFPDRLCTCHLGDTKHPEKCGCRCDKDDPTQMTKDRERRRDAAAAEMDEVLGK